ncbi:MAG: hypothetical protein KAT34_10110 [Candidatus Aminicenantes bacterium]|nr:hypothetical protein [Candidatus Aminicenantes bacterium]
MHFAWKIVDINVLLNIIELPEELLESEVEINVLPCKSHTKTRKKKVKMIDYTIKCKTGFK